MQRVLPFLARAVAGCLLIGLLAIGPNAVRAQAGANCPPAAVTPTAEQVQAGLRGARDRGFLWRISKGGRSSFLYGTVHVATLEWMYPGPQTLQALNGADTVALELDLLDADVQRRMATAIAARRQPPLPAALEQRVQRQARAECIAPDMLAGMSPVLQIATLAALAARRDGLDPAYGIDLFLAAYAHNAAKAVVSLETPELQLDALHEDPDTPIETLVASGLDELESGRTRPLLNRLVRSWAEANDAELGAYESWCECLQTAADRRAMHKMLDDRNPALANSIDTLHSSGKKVFAAVGSLHMFGPQGLPALLARRGYRVERIAPKR